MTMRWCAFRPGPLRTGAPCCWHIGGTRHGRHQRQRLSPDHEPLHPRPLGSSRGRRTRPSTTTCPSRRAWKSCPSTAAERRGDAGSRRAARWSALSWTDAALHEALGKDLRRTCHGRRGHHLLHAVEMLFRGWCLRRSGSRGCPRRAPPPGRRAAAGASSDPARVHRTAPGRASITAGRRRQGIVDLTQSPIDQSMACIARARSVTQECRVWWDWKRQSGVR